MAPKSDDNDDDFIKLNNESILSTDNIYDRFPHDFQVPFMRSNALMSASANLGIGASNESASLKDIYGPGHNIEKNVTFNNPMQRSSEVPVVLLGQSQGLVSGLSVTSWDVMDATQIVFDQRK